MNLGKFLVLALFSITLVSCANQPSALTPDPTQTAHESTSTPAPSNTPEPTQTDTPPTTTPEPVAIPESFTVTLYFSEGTRCYFDGFDLTYTIMVAGETITFHQLSNDLVLPGSFDPHTGEFSVEAKIPRLGKETLTGMIETQGNKITLAGEFSYFGDPNLPCGDIWPFIGELYLN